MQRLAAEEACLGGGHAGGATVGPAARDAFIRAAAAAGRRAPQPTDPLTPAAASPPSSSPSPAAAATRIQAVAATRIQAAWRGWAVRRHTPLPPSLSPLGQRKAVAAAARAAARAAADAALLPLLASLAATDGAVTRNALAAAIRAWLVGRVGLGGGGDLPASLPVELGGGSGEEAPGGAAHPLAPTPAPPPDPAALTLTLRSAPAPPSTTLSELTAALSAWATHWQEAGGAGGASPVTSAAERAAAAASRADAALLAPLVAARAEAAAVAEGRKVLSDARALLAGGGSGGGPGAAPKVGAAGRAAVRAPVAATTTRGSGAAATPAAAPSKPGAPNLPATATATPPPLPALRLPPALAATPPETLLAGAAGAGWLRPPPPATALAAFACAPAAPDGGCGGAAADWPSLFQAREAAVACVAVPLAAATGLLAWGGPPARAALTARPCPRLLLFGPARAGKTALVRGVAGAARAAVVTLDWRAPPAVGGASPPSSTLTSPAAAAAAATTAVATALAVAKAAAPAILYVPRIDDLFVRDASRAAGGGGGGTGPAASPTIPARAFRPALLSALSSLSASDRVAVVGEAGCPPAAVGKDGEALAAAFAGSLVGVGPPGRSERVAVLSNAASSRGVGWGGEGGHASPPSSSLPSVEVASDLAGLAAATAGYSAGALVDGVRAAAAAAAAASSSPGAPLTASEFLSALAAAGPPPPAAADLAAGLAWAAGGAAAMAAASAEAEGGGGGAKKKKVVVVVRGRR